MAKEKDIAVMCPNLTCRTVLRVPGNTRGKKVRCMKCGTNLIIPQLRTTTDETAAGSNPGD